MDHVAAAKKAIVAKFRDVASRFHESTARVESLQEAITAEQEIQRRLSAEAQDCHAAARLFGFDLVAALAADNGQPPAPLVEALPTASEPKSQPDNEGVKVRTFVLSAVREAYPEPVRAADLRRQLEARGQAIHEKTIGMTLYRLSKKGLVRREGFDWYFVPPAPAGANSTGKEHSDAGASERLFG